MNENELFESMGYLANPVRQTRLDAEMLEKDRARFEDQYYQLTGIRLTPNENSCYRLHDNADKWGIELRIYFVTADNVPESLREMIVSSISGSKYNARINRNEFFWNLVNFGFLLGDMQDETRIRERVPKKFIADFNRGYKIK